MHALIFTPDRNVKGRDFSGAFFPEAVNFAKHHKISMDYVFKIDVSKDKRSMRRAICDLITTHGSDPYNQIESIVFFCHGWKTGIQLGFDIDTLHELSNAMKNCAEYVIVPIYACSAARDSDFSLKDDLSPYTVGGDGGFCDVLRDNLCSAGRVHCRVMGHVTVGHSTLNPWAKFFDGGGMTTGGSGGYWIVRPHGPLWHTWIEWLRKSEDGKPKWHYVGNQYKFPYMMIRDIRNILIKRKAG